jgi:hypothetical protein
MGALEKLGEENLTRDISGEIFSSSKIAKTTQSRYIHVFVHNSELYTNLSSRIEEIIEV